MTQKAVLLGVYSASKRRRGVRWPPGFARAVSLVSGGTLILFGLYAVGSGALTMLG